MFHHNSAMLYCMQAACTSSVGGGKVCLPVFTLATICGMCPAHLVAAAKDTEQPVRVGPGGVLSSDGSGNSMFTPQVSWRGMPFLGGTDVAVCAGADLALEQITAGQFFKSDPQVVAEAIVRPVMQRFGCDMALWECQLYAEYLMTLGSMSAGHTGSRLDYKYSSSSSSSDVGAVADDMADDTAVGDVLPDLANDTFDGHRGLTGSTDFDMKPSAVQLKCIVLKGHPSQKEVLTPKRFRLPTYRCFVLVGVFGSAYYDQLSVQSDKRNRGPPSLAVVQHLQPRVARIAAVELKSRHSCSRLCT